MQSCWTSWVHVQFLWRQLTIAAEYRLPLADHTNIVAWLCRRHLPPVGSSFTCDTMGQTAGPQAKDQIHAMKIVVTRNSGADFRILSSVTPRCLD